MLYCKNCEKFMPMADEKNGVCSLPESYFPTKEDNICIFLKKEKQHCSDCDHFVNDFACMTVDENDDICSAFVSYKENILKDIIFNMCLRDENAKENISKIIDEFLDSDLIKFINNHRNDIIENYSED